MSQQPRLCRLRQASGDRHRLRRCAGDQQQIAGLRVRTQRQIAIAQRENFLNRTRVRAGLDQRELRSRRHARRHILRDGPQPNTISVRRAG